MIFNRARPHPIKDTGLGTRMAGFLLDALRDIKRSDFENAVWIGGGNADALQGIKNISALTVRPFPVDGDIEHFPFEPQSLDLIVANGTLHTVNDLPGVLVQMKRALKPDGLFLCAITGGETLFELRDSILQVEMLKNRASARVHPMIDLQTFSALMQRAGFALPVVDAEKQVIYYRALHTLLRDIKAVGEGMALVQTPPYPGKNFWNDVETDYRARHVSDDGLLEATIEIISAIGWAPADTQQQPLKPGSAKTRLADALGSDEIALPEKTRPH